MNYQSLSNIKVEWKRCEYIHTPRTILSIVDFAENYTFVAQNEIQSEYYHYDQVFMLFHVLYRHA